MKNDTVRREYSLLVTLAIAILSLALGGTAQAANYTWTGGVSTSWAASGDWTVTSGSYPTSTTSDTAFFSGSTTAVTVDLDGNQSVNKIDVLATETGGVLIDGGGSPWTLTIGNGGITSGSGAGTLTIGGGGGVTINMTASQGWLNAGAGNFTYNANITNSASTGSTITLTIGGGPTYGGGNVFNGNISNGAAGGVTAINASLTNGSTTLAGDNTYTGTTTVATGGSLILSGTLGDGVGGGTAITNGKTFTETSTGSITGTSSYTTTAGSSSIAGFNSYTGVTNIGAETVVTFTGTLGGGINGGTAITLSNGSAIQESSAGLITGTSSITLASNVGSTATVLLGANNFTGPITVNGGTLQIGNGGTSGTIVGSGTLTINGGVFEIDRSNAAVQGTDFSGAPITGAGSFTIAGSGTTTLNALNTYTGSTTVGGGSTLFINNPGTSSTASAIGASTLVINGANAVIDNTSGSAETMATNNPETWNNNFTFIGSNNLNFGTGNVSITTNIVLTANAGVLTYGGVISGAKQLTKGGNGTLVLTGDNTFGAIAVQSGLTLNAGILDINNQGTGSTNSAIGIGTLFLTSGTFDNTSGAPETLATNNAITFNGNVAFSTGAGTSLNNLNLGTGAISTNGASADTLTLNGVGTTLTFGGAFTFGGNSGGTLTLVSTSTNTINSLVIGSLSLLKNTITTGVGTFNGNANLTVPGAITSGGTSVGTITAGLTYSGNAVMNVEGGSNAYIGNTSADGGTLLASSGTGGTPFGTGGNVINNGDLSISPTGNSGSNVAFTGASAGGAGFAYGGDAELILNKGGNASVSYTVGSGTASANSVVGRSPSVGATLIIAPANGVGTSNFGAASGGEQFIVNGGVTVVNGMVNGSIVGQNNDAAGTGDFLTYGSTGFVSASSNYTESGGSTFTAAYGAIEDITSNATINTGGNPQALRVDGTSTTLTDGGTITVGSTNSLVGGIILNGGSISGGTLTTPTSGEFAIYVSGSGGTISSVLGTATTQKGLSVFGPGTLTLSAASNTYLGSTFINDSTLSITSDAELGSGTDGIVLNGGTLQTSGAVSLGTTGQRSIVLNLGQTNTGGTFNVATGGTTTYTSVVGKVISGSGSLTKTGAGAFVLIGTGTDTYSGGTYVNGGLLQIQSSNILANTGALTVNGGAFDINSNSTTLGSVALVSGSITGTTGVLTGASYTLSSGLVSAVLGGSSVALSKITAGTVKLSNSNTYTGATTVTAGMLIVSGSLSGSSSTTVTNATLAGTGSITNGVTIGSGTGAAGSAVVEVGQTGTTGTLSTGALSLKADSVYELNLNPTLDTSDLLNVTGSITLLSGSLAVNLLSDEVLNSPEVFDIANYTTSLSGTFAGLANGSTFQLGDNSYTINYGTLDAGEITLESTAVPEPGTWAMLLGGGGVLVFWQRMRRRRDD